MCQLSQSTPSHAQSKLVSGPAILSAEDTKYSVKPICLEEENAAKYVSILYTPRFLAMVCPAAKTCHLTVSQQHVSC
jgi:hypothetical protein